ncbi:hypothetical protein FACS189490_06740 [Clostridia bacterium]|nr:hypothetical protein FACS189490_06740 [Clostridia bacterium]
MTAFKNLKIKAKLLISFIIVIVLAVVIAVIGVVSLLSTNDTYNYLLQYPNERYKTIASINANVVHLRRIMNSMVAYDNDLAEVRSLKTNGDQAYTDVLAEIADYKKLINDDDRIDVATVKTPRTSEADRLIGYISQYHDLMGTVQDTLLAGNYTLDDIDKLLESGAAIASNATSTVDDLLSGAEDTIESGSLDADNSVNSTLIMLIAVAVVVAIIAVILAFVIAGIIVKPIAELVGVANNVAEGNLNINIRTDAKDETGDLARSFSIVVKTVNDIVSNMDVMSKKHDDGELEYAIDDAKFKGSYRNVVVGVNGMVQSYIAILDEVMATLEAIASGTFVSNLPKYKGGKEKANRIVDSLIATLRNISETINNIAVSGAEGKLSTRADAKKFAGEWAGIVNGLNKLLDNIVTPINESLSVIKKMSEGDFSVSMSGAYQGDFNELKTGVNFTVKEVSTYINDITATLTAMSKGDLTQHISRQYVGDFVAIKESINTISKVLNDTMSEISSASSQVLTGAKQISQSAMMLAEGATEQASSVQELTATVEEINKQVQDSTKNAEQASKMSNKSKTDAEQGNTEMAELLTAMDGIKSASNKIANIIKVIEEIATQTNLLALNAAVEAARAGEHGKGFTVVADSVRDLAVQSKSAAKETSDLIQEAINQVEGGSQRANATAASLNRIVEGATGVSDMIAKISTASDKQAEAVGNVSIGLNQISQVVQSNSATSEESAAASEELNSQAETLQQMVSFFKTK